MMHPTGRLKPNDLGLFDVLGNAYEWCLDPYLQYTPAENSKPTMDALVDAEFSDQFVRVLRGGSFDYSAPYLRSAHRGRLRPSVRDTDLGFRPARTYH
ncbi:MAG: SUMF1/EgtB/PvdO family nonheme iron enzyme [Singulisphaera sp.]|nr:SUMF1/EgtB/PvdO family nonheme iron enzyme [Singulisphaera sp.]